MALPKRVMVGGAYYKGYKLTVDATPGDYILDMTVTGKSCAVNSISVVPDVYGAGDHFKLEHLDATDALQSLLADTIYNVGKSIAWLFDFPAYELMGDGHKFRLTYTNVAGKALNVYTNLERLTTKSGGV
jgi:hypothetical protein